jgi:hypothetical protein
MLGRAEMAVDVDSLAEHYGKKQGSAGEQAADPYALPKSKLVIMVCEGVRFHTVYGRVDKEFDHAAAKLSKVEGDQVKEWEKISEKVRKWDVDPAAKFPDLEKIGIKDKNDAARIVVLVKDEKREDKIMGILHPCPYLGRYAHCCLVLLHAQFYP